MLNIRVVSGVRGSSEEKEEMLLPTGDQGGMARSSLHKAGQRVKTTSDPSPTQYALVLKKLMRSSVVAEL